MEKRHYINTFYLIILQELACPSHLAQFRGTSTVTTVMQFTCSGKRKPSLHRAVQFHPPQQQKMLWQMKIEPSATDYFSVNWHKTSAVTFFSDVDSHLSAVPPVQNTSSAPESQLQGREMCMHLTNSSNKTIKQMFCRTSWTCGKK